MRFISAPPLTLRAPVACASSAVSSGNRRAARVRAVRNQQTFLIDVVQHRKKSFFHPAFDLVPLNAVSKLLRYRKPHLQMRCFRFNIYEYQVSVRNGLPTFVNVSKLFVAPKRIFTPQYTFHPYGCRRNILSRQLFPASCTPALQDISARLGLHSFSESVFFFPLPLLRLISHFHNRSIPSFIFKAALGQFVWSDAYIILKPHGNVNKNDICH